MSALELLPAVDVRKGRAVQLVAGSLDDERRYGDPMAAALARQADGATWIHLVDIDAAFGRGDNRPLLAAIVERLDIDVQLSGGIVDEASLADALATGCRRLVLGTAALTRLDWCAHVVADHGDRIVVGLDVANGDTLAARGTTAVQGRLDRAVELLGDAGCARWMVTDVDRDGRLDGPNIDLVRHVCDRTDAPVVVSGGVATLGDVDALAALTADGVEGAVIGSALHEGRFTLADALDRAAASR